MRNIIFIFLSLPVFLFSQEKLYQEIKDQCELRILNPSLKNRKCAKIRLHNGLQALLISDDKADQSAAALSVGVGSWSDPVEYPGMAHFTEHMLFMGSETYPNENEFWRVIFDNSGKTNAFTSFDRTVYMFSINQEAFEDAFDRFAHFFIDPLLHPSGIARELHAVDQEYAKNIENDNWRMYQISKEIGNQNHPNVQFSCGNSQTLSVIPHNELKGWYEKSYSANRMHLVVYSPLPIEDLKEKVALIFSQVPNRGADALVVDQPLSSEDQTGKFVFVEPIRNTQKLYLEWEVDPSYIHEDSKSIDLIAYALKRGQKKSLVEALKKEQLAEKLDIGVERLGDYHLLFQIEIELTDQGVNDLNTVITRTFQAIEGMKQTGIPPYLFHEMKTMSRINYEYQDREDAFEFVMQHGSALKDEDLASYPQKLLQSTVFNPQAVQSLLHELTPDSCHFYILAPSEKTEVVPTRQEKWLGGQYAFRSIEKAAFNQWKAPSLHGDIKIADPSPFLPSQLKVVNQVEELPFTKDPIRIVENEHGKVFYAKDEAFFTPEVTHLLHIRSPVLDGSPRTRAMSDVYLKSLLENLDPVLSCARSSGLEASFSADQCQFTISIRGYSEKAPPLVEEILKVMTHWELDGKKFENDKAYVLKKYENMERELPVFQAKELLNSVTTTDQPTSKEKYTALEGITYEEFSTFQKKLFETTYTEALLSGNLTLKDAESIWLDIRHLLSGHSYPKKNHHHRKVLAFPDGPFMVQKDTIAQGNGVILVLDQGPFSFQARAAQNVLAAALREAFFSTLRTKQQTAYIAKAWDEEVEMRLFQYFAVQSSTHQPLDLIYRFELFLEEFLQEMPYQFPRERFESIKENLIITLRQLGTRNQAEKASLLNKLAFEYENFSWIDERVEGLENLGYDEFLSYCRNFISRDNKKRLAILFEGKPLAPSPFTYKGITCDQITSAGKYIVNVKTNPLTSGNED